MKISFEGRVYFSAQELRCKSSGKLILAKGFADQLLALRLAFNRPMVVTSACRSKEHNARVGGAKNSFHICDTGRGCCAVDIATTDPLYRTALVQLALNSGWSVGISRTFVHLDRRIDYVPNCSPVIFVY